MKILCVIPSRLGSTRLQRKPLSLIQGKPMIEWVYASAKRCSILTDVVVATDSQEIVDVVEAVGGKAVMTDPELPTGSDRVAVVAEQYADMQIIINLQGDEPFIQPLMLQQLVAPYLAGESPEMTTLACPLNIAEEYHSPDIVKVITDRQHNAIYFSRAAIPYFRKEGVSVPVYHHLGVYAFRRDFLLQYRQLPQTPLQTAESLEQLRVLEHGYRIRVCLTEKATLEVNTPEELARAQYFNLTEQTT